MMQSEPEGGSWGSLIAIIVIIAIIVLGGVYFWGKNKAGVPNEANNSSLTTDPEDIEADLNNTDLDIEADLNAIDAGVLGS